MPENSITSLNQKWPWLLNAAYSNQSQYEISAWNNNFNLFNQIWPKRPFPVLKGKSEHHFWTLHIQMSLNIKFQLQITILTFRTKFSQKRSYHSKTKVSITTIKFCIFISALLQHFSLKLQFRFFGPNLPKKGIFNLKQKKWTSLLNSPYSKQSNYWTSAWNNNFDFLDHICPKRVFLV